MTIALDSTICPHGYFDAADCLRCTPPEDGRCTSCGTLGDHYCPSDVDHGETDEPADLDQKIPEVTEEMRERWLTMTGGGLYII